MPLPDIRTPEDLPEISNVSESDMFRGLLKAETIRAPRTPFDELFAEPESGIPALQTSRERETTVLQNILGLGPGDLGLAKGVVPFFTNLAGGKPIKNLFDFGNLKIKRRKVGNHDHIEINSPLSPVGLDLDGSFGYYTATVTNLTREMGEGGQGSTLNSKQAAQVTAILNELVPGIKSISGDRLLDAQKGRLRAFPVSKAPVERIQKNPALKKKILKDVDMKKIDFDEEIIEHPPDMFTPRSEENSISRMREESRMFRGSNTNELGINQPVLAFPVLNRTGRELISRTQIFNSFDRLDISPDIARLIRADIMDDLGEDFGGLVVNLRSRQGELGGLNNEDIIDIYIKRRLRSSRDSWQLSMGEDYRATGEIDPVDEQISDMLSKMHDRITNTLTDRIGSAQMNRVNLVTSFGTGIPEPPSPRRPPGPVPIDDELPF